MTEDVDTALSVRFKVSLDDQDLAKSLTDRVRERQGEPGRPGPR